MTLGTEVEGISVVIDADISKLTQGLSEASKKIETAANGPLNQAARQLDDTFHMVGESIKRSLSHAAHTGKFSFKDMVTSILRDLQRLAIKKFITGPINNLLDGLFSNLSFGGGKAAGGSVLANTSYLVGERGPELFVPSGQGQIVPTQSLGQSAPVTVHFHMPAGTDMASFQRSETQISSMLTRAMTRGQRNL